MQQTGEGVSVVLVLLVAAALAVYVVLRIRGRVMATKRMAARLADLERQTTEQWARISTSGYVQAVRVPGIHLREDELAVTTAESTLYQLRSAGGMTVGTRLKVAGVPLYMAQSVRSNTQELREVGPGRMVLTNKRLLVIGTSHSVDVPLRKVTFVEAGFDTVRVTVSERAAPLVLTVGNPVLLMLVMNALIDGSLTVRPAATAEEPAASA